MGRKALSLAFGHGSLKFLIRNKINYLLWKFNATNRIILYLLWYLILSLFFFHALGHYSKPKLKHLGKLKSLDNFSIGKYFLRSPETQSWYNV